LFEILSNAVLYEGFSGGALAANVTTERKNKHRIFLNLEQEEEEVPVRVKIAARLRLLDWLSEQGADGANLIRIWKLDDCPIS